MSILGQTATTLSTLNAVIGIICIVALSISFALCFVLGVYRPRAVVGPQRLPSDQPAFRLIVGLAMGFSSWILASSFYVTWKTGAHPPPGTDIRQHLTPGDWAYLATVPQVAFFVTLLLADWAIGGIELLDRLGISLRRLSAGVRKGMFAAIIILPPTYFLTFVAEWFYNRVQFQHPHEHELLKVMREPQKPTMHWVLILAAVLVAPVFEEFLFRGHLQTLLRRALVAITARWRMAQLRKQQEERGLSLDAMLAPANVPVTTLVSVDLNLEPAVWQTWTAILLTSALFASVHPMWMAPPIFFLALGLGYCYERTGNLWAPMTVHCLFNSISTIIFLTMK